MCCVVRNVAPAICVGLAGLVLAGCGNDSSGAAKQPAPRIQGELITPVTNGGPKETTVAATTPPAASTPAAVPEVNPAAADYPAVGFDKLASYNFDVPDDGPVTNTAVPDKVDDQIPVRVKAYNSQKVCIKGFMLPLKVEDGAVTEFLLLKDQSMCCYGNVPKITEWISVKTKSKGMKPIMDVPVNIEGTLHVGAMRENGYLVGIYHMDGDKMVGGN
jgi:hypothetical protein